MLFVLLFSLLILAYSVWRIRVLKHELQRLELLLGQDELTGVRSRRSLLLQSRRAVKAANVADPAQLVFVDMNDLKALNTLGGHAAGDIALRELGQQLNRFCEKQEWVARYGGDEFVLLLRSTPEEVEQRMVQLLSRLELRHRFTWAQCKLAPHTDWFEQINDLSRQVLLKKSKPHEHTQH